MNDSEPVNLSKIKVRYALIGVASTLALGALAGVVLYKLGFFPGPFSYANSPIRVVGGSIKLHANDRWSVQNCTAPPNPPSTPCIVSVNNGIDATKLSVEVPLDQLYSWLVTIRVSDMSGNPSQHGTEIYPSDNSGNCNLDNNLCRASASTKVAAKTLSADTDLPDDNDATHHHHRYRDAIQSEMPNIMTVKWAYQQGGMVYSQDFPCPKGKCNVYINPQ